MSLAPDPGPAYNGTSPAQQQEPDSGRAYLSGRALARATDAALDLFRALRAGDVSNARWLLDAVYGQVASLPGGASPPQ